MQAARAHIISQLQKDILLLEGFKPSSVETNDAGLGLIKSAFPQTGFPLGAIHEFLCSSVEEGTAASGFIAALLSSLMKTGAPSVWITSVKQVFPPALRAFGIEPHQIVFIQSQKPKDILWALEEALKCDALSAVVGEISEISFLESRRLQLAMEKTRVTGFLLRQNPVNLSTASVTKWRVKPIPSAKEAPLPGLGFPRWNIELLKVRSGKPGSWQMQWKKGRFELIQQEFMAEERKRKIV